MRLGLDYGGTKIEGIVLDPDGAERARARVPTPRHDYDGCIRAIRGLLEQLEAAAGGRIERVGIGVPGSVDRDDRRRQQATRPGCTAATCAATSPRRSTGRSRSPTTPTASRSARRSTAPARGAGGVRRHPRLRRRRRRRRARPARRGRQRHRRRVGPCPAADAARRRAPGAALLLRRRRPHRGLALGPRASPRTTRGARRCPSRTRRRRRRSSRWPPPATPRPRRRCGATRTGSAGRWR